MYKAYSGTEQTLCAAVFLISFVIEQHGKTNRGTVSSAKVAAVLLI